MKRVDQWDTIAAVAAHWTEQQLGKGRKARAYLGSFAIASRLDRLARIAATLHRLYEYQCNEPTHLCPACGGPDDGVDRTGKRSHRVWGHIPSKCFEARLARLEERAVAIGAELEVVVETQRDPRGASVKLWSGNIDSSKLLGCFS